jgi:glycosyltransferase involved in cell wall biosynthesis
LWTVPKSRNAKFLKIGIDARLAYRRGVGTYAANLILNLARIDHRNEYVIFNAPDGLKGRTANNRFHWVNLPFSNAAYYEQVLLPRVAAEQGLDFLHYIDNSATAISDLPFVLTLHDTMHTRPLAEVRPGATFRQKLVYSYKRWAISRSAPRAKAILTVSDYSKNRIVWQMGIPEERIVVTPEGVDLKLFRPAKRKPSKLFKILVHGAADERKNIPNILKAAKLLVKQTKAFQLVIIGMDEKELKCTDYIQQVIDMGLGSQVEWAGNVPHWALNQVYADVDLFLYPSLMEGFGLPVLEAFACGLPVITSNITSLPEVAGNAALLVDPKSPEAIVKAVGQMMKLKGLRKLYVQRGLRRAKQFSWEKTAKMTLKVYEQLGLN